MKIAIIGGGITGLTTSLALQKFGFENIVYEQASELNEVGAGVWLQPNAIKVLNWLGLREQITSEGIELERMEVSDRNMQPYKKMQNQVVEDSYGNRTIAIHRAKLQKILFENVQKNGSVRLAMTYKSHVTEGNKEVICFENQDKINADLLIGADGIHSKVRKQLFPNSSLRDSDQVCWRGISSMKLSPELKYVGKEMWGPHLRFGLSSVSESEVYWFAVMNVADFNTKDMDLIPYLTERFSKFHPLTKKIIQNTNAKSIHQGKLLDLKPLKNWFIGNTILLGDAAHATTPNMGQGACQGIEDAYYFSNLLKEHKDELHTAFELFQRQREKKVNQIVKNSWRFGKMVHSTFGQIMMKTILKLTPESVMSKEMNKLYEVEGL